MTKTTFKRWGAGIAGLLILGIFVWGFFAKPVPRENVGTRGKPVKTVTVTETRFQPTEEFSGFTQGIRETNVAPKISGYVVSLTKEPGDAVRAGETVAILDGNDLVAGDASANAHVKSAIEIFQKTKRSSDQTVAEARAHLSKTKKDRDNGNATDKDVRVAEESVESAERLRDVHIAEAEGGVVSARGLNLVSQTVAQNRFVRAPFSGVITEKNISLGSFVAPGTPLYTVSSPSELEVVVSVPEHLARTLQKNAPVRIAPEHSKESFSGFVFSVARAVQKNTGETAIRVRFGDTLTEPLPLPGTYATVAFPAEPERSAFLVPETALVRAYDNTFVFMVENGVARKKPVTLGSSSDTRWEIVSGLRAGDAVIVEGIQNLQDGMLVSE